MSFAEPKPGVFVVHYATAESLGREQQTALIGQVEQRAATGKVAMVFVLEGAVRSIDPGVPLYWHEVLRRVKVSGMAVVTGSRAVKAAATGFNAANAFLKLPTRVQTFTELRDAQTWAEALTQG